LGGIALYGGAESNSFLIFWRFVVVNEEQESQQLVLCPAPGWLLVCRGESVLQRRGILPGELPEGLAEGAETEVRQRARDFLGIPVEVIYCGEEPVCRESARILAGGEFIPVHTDARINDVDYGIWSGRWIAVGAMEIESGRADLSERRIVSSFMGALR
jgi:hypothetical protein